MTIRNYGKLNYAQIPTFKTWENYQKWEFNQTWNGNDFQTIAILILLHEISLVTAKYAVTIATIEYKYKKLS